MKGNDAYNRRDYEETVDAIEEALQRYLEAEEECRLLCEGHFEHAPALDLTMSIASNHLLYFSSTNNFLRNIYFTL